MKSRVAGWVNIACVTSAALTLAALSILMTDHVRSVQLALREQQREEQLKAAAQIDLAAAEKLHAECDQRTARRLALHDKAQWLAVVAIGGSIMFFATARYASIVERPSALPPCKRGEKCRVLKSLQDGLRPQ